MIGEETTLEGFDGWEELSSETDFFAVQQPEDVKTDAKSVIEKISSEEEEEEDKNRNPEGGVEKDLFQEEESIENQERINNEEDDEDEPQTGSNITILNSLKEKGLIDFELEEGEELTDDLADELIEDKWEESVDKKVKHLLTNLPEKARNLIQYAIDGGDVDDYIDALTSDTGLPLDVSLEKEENQILVLKHLLRLEDKDDEEIETEIDYLKDSGKLKTISEKKFNKYKSEIQEKEKELLIQQEQAKEAEKKAIKEAKARVSTFVNTNEEIEGIRFTKEDKIVLASYMNDKVVKLNNGNTITTMQKELFIDLPKNEKALIQLATLLRNRNEDGTFNFESIIKKAATEVSRTVKENIRRNKSSIPASTTSKNKQSEKSLADYFNN